MNVLSIYDNVGAHIQHIITKFKKKYLYSNIETTQKLINIVGKVLGTRSMRGSIVCRPNRGKSYPKRVMGKAWGFLPLGPKEVLATQL